MASTMVQQPQGAASDPLSGLSRCLAGLCRPGASLAAAPPPRSCLAGYRTSTHL
jgi:hypothetical protein